MSRSLAAAGAWGLVLAVATLTPNPGADLPGTPWCLACGPRGLADVIGNILLFLPLGLALGASMSVARAALWAAAAAVAIELIQVGVPGRHPALGDVLFDTVGGGLGAWLGAGGLDRILRWAAPSALAAFAAPMLLLAPSPQTGVYYGQWTARFWNLEPYEGRVLDARIGTVRMPEGPSEQSGELQELLRARAPLEVDFEVGPPPAGLAPLFSVYDHVQQEVLLLGVDGHDLVFRERLRAADLRLDHPDLMFPGALAGIEPGARVRARIARDAHSPCMTLDRRIRCDLAPGFAAGWTMLLYPPPLGRGWSGTIDLLWATALAVPLGWWMRRRLPALIGAAALASALLVWAHLTPDTRATPWPAAFLVAGAALGAWARVRWRDLRSEAQGSP